MGSIIKTITKTLFGQDASGVEQNEKIVIIVLITICIGFYSLALYLLKKIISNSRFTQILSIIISVILFFILLSTFVL